MNKKLFLLFALLGLFLVSLTSAQIIISSTEFIDYELINESYNIEVVVCETKELRSNDTSIEPFYVCVKENIINETIHKYRKEKTGEVVYNGKVIKKEGFCAVYVGNNRVDMVSKTDGIHLGDCKNARPCSEKGGESCEIIIFKTITTFDKSFVNSDIYVKNETVTESETLNKYDDYSELTYSELTK